MTNQFPSDLTAAIEQRMESPERQTCVWARELPREAGYYWHWNGDEDCAPLIWSIGIFGADERPQAYGGQYGRICTTDCAEMGGWWLAIADQMPTKGKS
jgi:hypothetical protein